MLSTSAVRKKIGQHYSQKNSQRSSQAFKQFSQSQKIPEQEHIPDYTESLGQVKNYSASKENPLLNEEISSSSGRPLGCGKISDYSPQIFKISDNDPGDIQNLNPSVQTYDELARTNIEINNLKPKEAVDMRPHEQAYEEEKGQHKTVSFADNISPHAIPKEYLMRENFHEKTPVIVGDNIIPIENLQVNNYMSNASGFPQMIPDKYSSKRNKKSQLRKSSKSKPKIPFSNKTQK